VSFICFFSNLSFNAITYSHLFFVFCLNNFSSGCMYVTLFIFIHYKRLTNKLIKMYSAMKSHTKHADGPEKTSTHRKKLNSVKFINFNSGWNH